MFQFLESPVVIWLIIMLFFLFFLALFFRMLPKTNGKHQKNTDTSMKIAEENRSKCTVFGFLEKLPRGDPIPDECMSCPKLVECAMAKRAFDWYLGQNLAQNSENGGTNRTEMPKHIKNRKKGEG